MTTLTIQQTLHGYREGHQLLAVSAPLAREVLGVIADLSDLSGYVPTGVAFERYITGYPCGPWYALAMTWPDPTAPRKGAVLTHTLLVELSQLAQLDAPWSLLRLHARFHGDLAPYRSPMVVPLKEVAEEPPPDTRRLIAERFFGAVHRPILWQRGRSGVELEEAVGWLWSVLWGEPRATLTFCTFAVQPRYLGERVFDILGVPRQSVASFQRHIPREGIRPHSGRWLDELVSDGFEARGRMQRWCQERGLPMPKPSTLPPLYRLMEIEVDAAKRLSAARARADLLTIVWPDIEVTHPYWEDTIKVLLSGVARTTSTRELTWELQDLIERPMVATRLRENAQWSETLMERLKELYASHPETLDLSALTERSIPYLLPIAASVEPSERLRLFDAVDPDWLRSHCDTLWRLIDNMDDMYQGIALASASGRVEDVHRARVMFSQNTGEWEDDARVDATLRLSEIAWEDDCDWSVRVISSIPMELLGQEGTAEQVVSSANHAWREAAIACVMLMLLGEFARNPRRSASWCGVWLRRSTVQHWLVGVPKIPWPEDLTGDTLVELLALLEEVVPLDNADAEWVAALLRTPILQPQYHEWSRVASPLARLGATSPAALGAVNELFIEAVFKRPASDGYKVIGVVYPLWFANRPRHFIRSIDRLTWIWWYQNWSVEALLQMLDAHRELRGVLLKRLEKKLLGSILLTRLRSVARASPSMWSADLLNELA